MSLRKHSRGREGALWRGMRSDHVNSRLEADNSRKIKIYRKRLRDIRDEIRRVYHRCSRPKREKRVNT